MAKTQGSLEERSPGHWRIRVYLGRDETGRQRFRTETVEGGKKDAEKRLRELVGQKDEGRLVKPARLTLAAYLREWLDTAVKARVKPRTLEFYREQVRLYVAPDLGPIRLDRLSTMQVQRWVNGLLDRGLSSRTVRAAFGTLHAALRQAVRWRVLSATPTEFVELPKQARSRELAVMTPEQTGAFLAAARGERHEVFFVLAVATGARPGELAALRWDDCDLERGTVAIRRALVRLAGGKVEYAEPKTSRGRRVIPLPPVALEALRTHKASLRKARMKAGHGWKESWLVFGSMPDRLPKGHLAACETCTKTAWLEGEPLCPHGELLRAAAQVETPLDLPNLRNRDLRRIALRARCPVDHLAHCDTCTADGWLEGKSLCEEGARLRAAAAAEARGLTLYSLRHSSASLLIAGGVHVKAVSERLGHASTAFTMDTYVHSLPTAQEHAAETLNRLVFDREKK